ncbi:hypothetical protein [Clostridium sp. OS1-26]|uniref:hypothetical protein n=1 Tax=Clostridium sp. OS1-26 TaxID=3070681 RepID=UPI0027E128C6|nr:hypothetical protein [Clostridium sp. OS1-26]WML37461.1 hypothetical protein RCG18_13095 [Clostridium sp. OS1-26]
MNWKKRLAKKKIIGVLMFILGAFGVRLCEWVQPIIASCNKDMFALICMTIFYLIFTRNQ